MSDEYTESPGEPAEENAESNADAGAGQPSEPTTSRANDAWHDVIGQLDALGEAMGRWARAAVNDPANRERVEELGDHMNKMADTVASAVGDVSRTDVGQQLKDAAVKTGEAFKAAGARTSEEVAPRVASAFRITAEKLHQAAERMERPAESSESSDDSEPAPPEDTQGA